MLMAPPKVAMKIVTRCTSVEQFIATYHRFCAPSSCFIPSLDSREIGREAAFSLRLADGTPLLRGLCVVLSSWTTPVNPFGRPGMHIALVRMTPESRALYDQLLAAAAAALASIPPDLVPADTVKVSTDVPIIPIAAPEDVTAPIPAGMAFDTLDDEGDAAVPGEHELEESTTRTSVVTTQQERDSIATLLGMVPLKRSMPTGNAVPVAIRGLPDDAPPPPPASSTPVARAPKLAATVPRPIALVPPSALVEHTLPIAARSRVPAMARLAGEIRPSRRGMRPLLITRAAAAMSRDERWWFAIAITVSLITVIALLASAYGSTR